MEMCECPCCGEQATREFLGTKVCQKHYCQASDDSSFALFCTRHDRFEEQIKPGCDIREIRRQYYRDLKEFLDDIIPEDIRYAE